MSNNDSRPEADRVKPDPLMQYDRPKVIVPSDKITTGTSGMLVGQKVDYIYS